MNKMIIGIDVGGTTVKIGLLSKDGEIIKKWEIPTDTSNYGLSIVDDIWKSIKTELEESKIKKDNIMGIGMGAPGFIDGETGYVYEAVNIGWKEYGLSKELKARSGLPVFVGNDANIAVLGENWRGAGKNVRNLIAITLGTGVGGGIIANGDILDGENGMAGEIGHITIDPGGYRCNCGRNGCLETIASATGIVRQAMDIIERDQESMLAEHFQETGSITAKDIFDLAKEGDLVSENIIKYTTDILGLVIANMGVSINPSKVLIGGGVSKAGDQLLLAIQQAFGKYAIPRVKEICEIRLAQLGNDAGIIGGAFLVRQKIESITF
ncbi:glucokinase [Virgibacillus profundi]|uniref:Glucokinase n=1 Tax=Virgibacillus profundi TaxID=2024555 RepID=A0A2A2IBS2_9BACI|nr:ROK family glucokinase [Virgibacillus profundi]PAV29067.1 glucokinase [Virgibacillus profundi]PXY53236.1 glucokinase [Virgibacillus profundi]